MNWKRMKFVMIGLGILGAMVYLVFSGIQATGVPYMKIGELVQKSPSETQYVKVTGEVAEDSLEYDPHQPEIDFQAKGPSGKDVRIIYEGIKPNAMREGGHVIVQGKWNPDRRMVRANTLLAKCPSRYQSQYENQSKSQSNSSEGVQSP